MLKVYCWFCVYCSMYGGSKICMGKWSIQHFLKKTQKFSQKTNCHGKLPKRFFDCILIFFFKNPKIVDLRNNFCFCGIFLKWGADVHTWLQSDIITSYVALIWPASWDGGLFWMLMIRFFIGCCCVCLFWVVVIVSVVGCLSWRYYYWTVLG